MKAPIPANETERLAALKSYHILDTAAEQSYDDIAALAAYVCEVPIALISLVDTARQWFKSKVGLEQEQTSREIAFCAYTILQREPFIVRDALKDSRFAKNPLVTDEPHIRFYAGFPLINLEGLALGSLCVIDRKPRQLSIGQDKAMRVLSKQVMTLLEFRRVSAHLADTLKQVKTLQALLPVCAWCNRIRDDKGYWDEVEAYLHKHAGVDFSHGICPECLEKVSPDERYRMIGTQSSNLQNPPQPT